MNLVSELKKICFEALQQAWPEAVSKTDLQKTDLNYSPIEITPATQSEFGHYQCNSAMKLTKVLQQKPREIAEKIATLLKEKHSDMFLDVTVAGPGFINMTLHPKFLSHWLTKQLTAPHLGVPRPNKVLKVIIDYSSPNVAKEMHVGHLRTTIIGDALARILRFMGHTVLGLNHIGDWGTQFGMLIAHLKTVYPAILGQASPDVHLSDLLQWYRAAKHRFDEDETFKKQAQLEVVKLQSGDPQSLQTWQRICDISRKGYDEIYQLLDVHLIERGESFYNPFLADIVRDLEDKGLVTLSNGAKCIYLAGHTNREGDPLPLILQKSDGGYNYATTDLAAIRHRLLDEKADWIIYVVDAGQTEHFQMIFETAQKAGYYDPKKVRVDHVPFGLVLRQDGKKFKTRAGETERLIDLLQVAIDKAKHLLQQRYPDLNAVDLEQGGRILGINAIKYADLSCHRTSDYVFNYDKMLQFEGNTAAFLLYAYVRARSIQRKVLGEQAQAEADTSVGIILKEPEEIALGLSIAQFPEVLDKILEDLCPNRLTDYLYRLAEKFHTFFHHCRVEGSDYQESRLHLCKAVARILEQGLHLLGLKLLEKM